MPSGPCGCCSGSTEDPGHSAGVLRSNRTVAEFESPRWKAHTDKVPVSLVRNARYWRDHAEEACAVAESMSDPESKRMMLNIADGYEGLARREEAQPRSPPMAKIQTDQRAGTVVSPKAADYQARAAECEVRAGEARDPEVKRQLVDLARQWRLMAEQAERQEW